MARAPATFLRSLRHRVAALSAVVVVTVLVGAGGGVVHVTSRDDRQQIDAGLRRQAAVLARLADVGVATSPRRGVRLPTPLEQRLDALLRSTEGAVRVYADGRLLFAAGGPARGRLPPAPGTGLRTLRTSVGDGWRSLTVAADGGRVRVETLRSLAEADARAATLRTTVSVLVVLGAVAAALLATLASGAALRPLRRLRRTADEVASTGDLARRVPEGGPVEVAAVSRALNTMLAQIETSAAERERTMAATQRFVADAGHELRTPLATLDATLELLVTHPELPAQDRHDALVEAWTEERRLAALADALQALARGDAGALGDEGEVDLQELVTAAVDAAARRHPEATFRLRPGPTVAPLPGSPSGLRRMVDNLLENAARHGGTRAAPSVEVALRQRPGERLLVVEDDGPGVPPEQRAAVFERFRRAPGGADGGSGLGLAIVAQQAALHGGSASIGASDRGGARVEVTLAAPDRDGTSAGDGACGETAGPVVLGPRTERGPDAGAPA
ncbi:HAMP domain-containing sensor histidine kinase [Patulibacter sp. SYSU D01012]|uniref:sensor histidine kinase n=1 Tax=Patulibacter sp. SYSU D01012 TaxID=2817381 RepID=UPI001B315283|nr:HAMP domain-containing sensor histidine kinase [Patulibacter sp. SYSU D01012]